MGLGKTIQAIAIAYFYKEEWPLLIVVPSSLRYPWTEEIEKWIPELGPEEITVIQNKTDVGGVSTSKVTVLGYGLLTTDAVTLIDALNNQNFKVVIVDESHYMKSRNAARSKILLPIVQKAKRAILLTGTPALGRPEEIEALFPQKFGTWTDYAKRYCNARIRYFGKRPQWDCRGASNLNELHQLLSDIMIRRLKTEVLTQLPPKIRQRIPFDLPSAAAKELNTSFEEWEKLMRAPSSGATETVMGLITRMFKQTAIAKHDVFKKCQNCALSPQLQCHIFYAKTHWFFFYPLDFTFVCHTEINDRAFNDRAEQFKKLNCQVNCASVDSSVLDMSQHTQETRRTETQELLRIMGSYRLMMASHLGAPLTLMIRQIAVDVLPVGHPVDETLRLGQAFQCSDKCGEAGAVKDYIKMMLQNDSLKFLVFAHHLNMLQACTEAVIENKTRYIRIDGSVPSSERIHLVNQFQKDPDTRVAILSIKAAGQGLTFTAATHVVFAELYWDPGHLKQAEDRAHRIGQCSSVNIHYLIANGTLDTLMWGMLNRKTQVTGSTLNGRKEQLQAEEGDKEKWDFLQFAEAWTPAESSEELNNESLFTH
ncbi:DNA annealing helicase and endonuclease ZRANB3, partial [Galemys pyrenaicus]